MIKWLFVEMLLLSDKQTALRLKENLSILFTLIRFDRLLK